MILVNKSYVFCKRYRLHRASLVEKGEKYYEENNFSYSIKFNIRRSNAYSMWFYC